MSDSKQNIATRESREVTEAYKEIVNFFCCYAMPGARKYLAKTIKAANTASGCKGMNPADVIYFYDMMKKLVKAAFVLTQNGAKRTRAILDPDLLESIDVNNCSAYCGRHLGYEAWHFFPRFLNKNEYCDPYKALRKVVSCHSPEKWKECLRSILSYAVNTNGYCEFHEEEDPLELYILLNKLLEACHLIDVRAIDEVDGHPRRKWEDKVKLEAEALKQATASEESGSIEKVQKELTQSQFKNPSKMDIINFNTGENSKGLVIAENYSQSDEIILAANDMVEAISKLNERINAIMADLWAMPNSEKRQLLLSELEKTQKENQQELEKFKTLL